MKISEKLSSYLTSRFNNKDEIFKSLIGDINGVANDPIVKSDDYNQGAISNEIEYLLGLINQTKVSSNINNITNIEVGGWEDILGLKKYSHETISNYISKVLSIVAGEKQTTYGIEQSMLNFTSYCRVIEIYRDSAFNNVSFTNYYGESVNPVIRPAFVGATGGGVLRIRVILKKNAEINNPAVRRIIMEILDIIVLPGVEYEVELID